MRTWLRFKVQEITLPVMINALEINARALGCHELLSEDMSRGRDVEGVTINNPFR